MLGIDAVYIGYLTCLMQFLSLTMERRSQQSFLVIGKRIHLSQEVRLLVADGVSRASVLGTELGLVVLNRRLAQVSLHDRGRDLGGIGRIDRGLAGE